MVVNGRLHDQITAGWYKKQAVIQQTGGKQGVKHSLMTDASGLPLSVVVAGANTHDIKLVADTLDALQTGKTGKNLRLCMDKGYEAEWLELYLKNKGYEPHIQSRKEESEAIKNSDFKTHLWVVERTNSWMNRFRRVLTRWEKKVENSRGMFLSRTKDFIKCSN